MSSRVSTGPLRRSPIGIKDDQVDQLDLVLAVSGFAQKVGEGPLGGGSIKTVKSYFSSPPIGVGVPNPESDGKAAQ